MKQKPWLLFFAYFALVVVYSCQEDEYCTLPLTSTVNIGFYTLHDDEMVTESIRKFWSWGIAQDSLINADTTGVDGISLELSNSKDSCMYLFISSVLDTIITYDTIPDKLFHPWGGRFSRIIDSVVIDTQVVEIDFTDTLEFIYLRQLTFISFACGYSYNYLLQDIDFTRNYIDTIVIINPTINTSREENVQILF